MGDENTHRCREPPFEAAIYNLMAKGKVSETFRANSESELTVEFEKSTEQEEKKQEYWSLELPVDFTKEDVSRVIFEFSFYKFCFKLANF